MIRLFFMMGLGIAVLLLNSCLENAGENGQIVVVGNGADWSQNLVADIRRVNEVESLVVSNQMNPVRLSDQLSGAESSAQLQWVGKTREGNFLIEVQEKSERRIYEQPQSSRSAERRRDLESLKPWGKSQPKLLSDGSAFFLNEAKELQYSPDMHSAKLVLGGVEEFFWAKSGQIFVRRSKVGVRTEWALLQYSDLMAGATPLSFQGGSLFESTEGDVYWFVKMNALSGNQAGEFQFLRWNGERFENVSGKIHRRLSSNIEIAAWNAETSELFVWESFGEQNQLLALGKEGIEIVGSFKAGGEILSTKDGRVFLISDVVQSCQKGLNLWNCRSFKIPSNKFVSVGHTGELVVGQSVFLSSSGPLKPDEVLSSSGAQAENFWKTRLSSFETALDSPNFGQIIRSQEFEGELDGLRMLRAISPSEMVSNGQIP